MLLQEGAVAGRAVRLVVAAIGTLMILSVFVLAPLIRRAFVVDPALLLINAFFVAVSVGPFLIYLFGIQNRVISWIGGLALLAVQTFLYGRILLSSSSTAGVGIFLVLQLMYLVSLSALLLDRRWRSKNSRIDGSRVR
jgi:hypothetical protein